MFPDSIFLCLKTTRRVSRYSSELERNLTMSVLWQSDKLVFGPHLLLSPASTVVKPAEHEFAHHPNPIQEGGSQCSLSRIVSRSYTRSVEEQRLDTQVIIFCKIFGLITCEAAYISHEADTRLLWVVAGIDLARMKSRGSWGRSCRRTGRSAGARWKRCWSAQV